MTYKTKALLILIALSTFELQGQSLHSMSPRDSSLELLSLTNLDTTLTLFKDSTFVFYKDEEDIVEFCSGKWHSTKDGYQLLSTLDSFWVYLKYLPIGSKQPQYFPVIMDLQFSEARKLFMLDIWYHYDCFSESHKELEYSRFEFESEKKYALLKSQLVYPFLKGKVVEIERNFGKKTITIDHIYYRSRYTNLQHSSLSLGDYVNHEKSLGRASRRSTARITRCDSTFSTCKEYR